MYRINCLNTICYAHTILRKEKLVRKSHNDNKTLKKTYPELTTCLNKCINI